jgi:hypothetical protein
MEKWKDIPEYAGSYQVSDLGRVRSLDRVVKCKNGREFKRKGKILKQGNKNGYKFVNLCYGNSVSVHTLVAKAFLGERPDKMDVCHINGNKSYNRLSNLEYGTRSKNNLDGYKIRGYVSCKQVLTPEKAKQIKEKLRNGATRKQLSEEFGCCKSTITAIKQGKLYGWIE